jgi:hypothetical protein
MISIRTVLVLGAGASKPYGYPTGAQLVPLIRANLEKSANSPSRQLVELGHSPSQISSFVRKLVDADYDSIDEFLRHNLEFEEIGKRAIAQVLLEKEFEHAADPARKEDGSWYHLFKSGILDEVILPGVNSSMLSVITFNYDRSLEFYLHRALTAGTSYPEGDILRILNSFNIHHIHGRLGHLPWQNGKFMRPYGSPVSSEAVQKSAAGIQLAHDSDPRYLDSLSASLMEDAERIIFLGFGYASSNLKKLGINSHSFLKSKRMIGTRYSYPLARFEDQITEFPLLDKIRHVPDHIDIPTFLSNHETLGKKLRAKAAHEIH